MSFYEQTGISIQASTPLVWTTRQLADLTLTDQISSFSKSEAALGGYEEAEFVIKLRQTEAEEWLADGLGRHIEIHNAALVKIWEGFVNQVDLNISALAVTRGPLVQVVNRASVIYGNLDTTQNPPTQTRLLQTAITEDTDSQDKYGIWEAVLSAGQTTQVDAELIRDTYLAEYAEPETSQTLNLSGQTGETTVTVHCRGYQDWLDAGIYNQVVNSSTTQMETKMADILDDAGADPNGLFASTNANIFTSGILVPEYDNENLKPRAIISGMIVQGDGTANYARTLWGVFNDREFVYSQIPTDIAYIQRLSDPSQKVTDTNDIIVKPWDVRAGRWVFFPDFLIGRGISSTPDRSDPRYLFIESVKYQAPTGLVLSGGKVNTLPQMLARAGLSGIG